MLRGDRLRSLLPEETLIIEHNTVHVFLAYAPIWTSYTETELKFPRLRDRIQDVINHFVAEIWVVRFYHLIRQINMFNFAKLLLQDDFLHRIR